MSTYQKHVKQLVKHIRKNGYNRFLLKEYSTNKNLDYCCLLQEFRSGTGKSFREFINEHRTTLFQRLLNNEFLDKGYCIAKKLGFKTEQQFYKWVKRNYGNTYKEVLRGGGLVKKNKNNSDTYY